MMSDIGKDVSERLQRSEAIRTGKETPWWKDAEASHHCDEWRRAREELREIDGPVEMVTVLRIDHEGGRWWMHDEGDSGDLIRYCPFCGVELPSD